MHLKSKGGFIGRAVLETQKTGGVPRKLCCFTSDPRLPLFGGEAILLNGDVVSLATSAGYGASVGKTILYGYLDAGHWEETDFELEAFGTRHPIRRAEAPLYDPENARMKD